LAFFPLCKKRIELAGYRKKKDMAMPLLEALKCGKRESNFEA
jgi:hypothetical protein